MKGEKDMESYEGLKRYEQLDHAGKVAQLMNDMEAAGIMPEKRKSRHGRKIVYYVGDDVVVALVVHIARKTKEETIYPVLLPKSYYDKHLKDGRYSLCMSIRRDGRYKVVVNGTGSKSMPALHQEVMREKRVSLDNRVVDHKHSCTWLNDEESLRACTNAENRHHSRPKKVSPSRPAKVEAKEGQLEEDDIGSTNIANRKEGFDEFAYNPLQDFDKTWYSYILYRMLGTMSEQELREYQRDYIMRNDEEAARYYKSILERCEPWH